MPQTNTERNERINLRLSTVAKQRIQRAASVEGKTVSAFIVSSALDSAEKAIERYEIMTLVREDAVRFFQALENPSAPNDRLRAALNEHEERVKSR